MWDSNGGWSISRYKAKATGFPYIGLDVSNAITEGSKKLRCQPYQWG